MKEIVDGQTQNCLNQACVQIELALDVVVTAQVYTLSPRWDALDNIRYDPYWDTLEEELPTEHETEKSCDIINQTNVVSVGNFPDDAITDPEHTQFLISAHQRKRSVGEQLFIASQNHPSAPQQYKSVGAQVLLATKSDLSETSVGAQVTNGTEKIAPQHEKLAHWVEKYWVERAGNKYWYFRYRWMLGRKSNRIYIGSVRSQRVQSLVELVREAIADGKSLGEIKQLIKGDYH